MTLNLATDSEHAAAAMNLAATPSKFKLTFGQLRAQGIRRLTVRCRNFSCEHASVLHGDRWGDNIRLSDVEPLLTCWVCRARGGELSPAPRIAVAVD